MNWVYTLNMFSIIWIILGIIAILALIIHWYKHATWGGFTAGIFVGLIIALFFADKFNLIIIIKGAIVGTIIGLLSELLGSNNIK